jgi:hypothetical protein
MMEFKFEELDLEGALEELREQTIGILAVQEFLNQETFKLPKHHERNDFQNELASSYDLSFEKNNIKFKRLMSIRRNLIKLIYWKDEEEAKCAS